MQYVRTNVDWKKTLLIMTAPLSHEHRVLRLSQWNFVQLVEVLAF